MCTRVFFFVFICMRTSHTQMVKLCAFLHYLPKPAESLVRLIYIEICVGCNASE